MTDQELEAKLTRVGGTTAPTRERLASVLGPSRVVSPWTYVLRPMVGALCALVLVVGGGSYLTTMSTQPVVYEDPIESFSQLVAEDAVLASEALALFDADVDALLTSEGDVLSDEFLDATFSAEGIL
ncbi:MAG: hypothetical protein NBV63_02455 [Candidatus Pacebacteria bacterium]|nr:hypothetical protein [Candidatus Paceibacterota bacterium]